MIKVIIIIGTRPEAIKMLPVLEELSNKKDYIEAKLCVTGQHRQMLDQVLEIFNVKPDYDLNIMSMNQSLEDITSNVLKGLINVFKEYNPDLILVHGDTTTTLAGALAGFYNKIKIGHVEAGLRSDNKYEPFPEEMNRRLAAHIADIHFCPTDVSKNNLLKEGILENSIYITGNTSIDYINKTLKKNYIFKTPILNSINYKYKRIIIVTAHRRENIGEPLKQICKAIKLIVNNYTDVEIVYAVHLNPKVQKIATEELSKEENVHLIPPIDIEDMHNLINKAYIILTDSGGIQEEAPSMDIPVLVLRNVTERPEGLYNGNLKLVGTNSSTVYNEVSEVLDNKDLYNKMSKAKNPYGDGKASKRIVDAILHNFNINDVRPNDYKV